MSRPFCFPHGNKSKDFASSSATSHPPRCQDACDVFLFIKVLGTRKSVTRGGMGGRVVGRYVFVFFGGGEGGWGGEGRAKFRRKGRGVV